MALSLLALASCQKNEINDASMRRELASYNFTGTFGKVATGQTWITTATNSGTNAKDGSESTAKAGGKSATRTVTIAFEDLGSDYDFDFNDLVVYVSHTPKSDSATVSIMAAGGTLPISLVYDGLTIWNKENYATIDNTVSWGGVIQTIHIPCCENFDLSNRSTLAKFCVKVELDPQSADETTCAIIPAVSAPGTTPLALVIEGKWAWPAERVKISKAYPEFAQWVGRPDIGNWTEDVVKSYVITPSKGAI